MRQTISGLVAAIAVMTASAAPAMACGGLFDTSCAPCNPCAQAYVPPPVYTGCDTGCGGWAHERLPDPVQQYYYADQGPTYTGPGNFAPYPTYREGGVSGAYRHHPYRYGYEGAANTEGPESYRYGYRHHTHFFRPWHHTGYRYGAERPSYRYGYATRHTYGQRYSLPPRQFYTHHGMRYGAATGAPRYGYQHPLRRYY
jgi:hypothetical protein